MSEPATPESAPADVIHADLCIVGAGIGGLNALFAATQYLARDQRVVLVDRRPRAGGMWIDTYAYVRLHQPHRLFTAGDISWEDSRDPAHLATRDEVLDHVDHIVDVLAQRVTLDERYGWSLQSAVERNGVRAAFRNASGEHLVVEAPRLIKAYGFDVRPNPPLTLSSTRVRSVSPNSWDPDSSDPASAPDAAPVWIVGSGKTATDTAYRLVTSHPGREVNMVTGRGTFFLSRETMFADGIRRWFGGKRSNEIGALAAHRFDGTNEAEVTEWFRAKFGSEPIPDAAHHFLGLLSETERATISAGLHRVVRDYLVDVHDHNETTELVLRSGNTIEIAAGSLIVNCTGYLAVHDSPYDPYVSPGGSILSINDRSAVLHLTTYAGYFLTHLMFLDKLGDVPLYELDMVGLREKGSPAAAYVLLALAQYNLGLIFDAVPLQVFAQAGFNLDRWYPPPRQLTGLAQFIFRHRRQRDRYRRTLDTVRERFGVRCGPLDREAVQQT
ncbi:NAD(P)-binding protein [Gordonia polyisoprenivorans]|uniref:NAD(P)-binding protein n=1 Tax=Gordonia polyisoprenivorans TaxID=84595 RepID=UPI002234B516|nr:NAD(P)-binding protein [Gordonia polyisoprenivorans]